MNASTALNRRHALRLSLGVLATLEAASSWAQRAPQATPVQVWKDASCGCCHDWIGHMQHHGFKITAYDTGNNGARARLGLAEKFGSCHTALVGGYVLEGHVHADDVRRLLRERPQALGLAVPGMPVGSPGMDGAAYGGRRDRYDTLLVQRDGTSRVFRHHNA